MDSEVVGACDSECGCHIVPEGAVIVTVPVGMVPLYVLAADCDPKVRQMLLLEAQTPLTYIQTGIVNRRRHLSLSPIAELQRVVEGRKK